MTLYGDESNQMIMKELGQRIQETRIVMNLAPAYDITYANDAANYWLARHQMSMNGKTERFNADDFYES